MIPYPSGRRLSGIRYGGPEILPGQFLQQPMMMLPQSSGDNFADLKEVVVKVIKLEGGPATRPLLGIMSEKTDPVVSLWLEDKHKNAAEKKMTSVKDNAGGYAVWNETLRLPYLQGYDHLFVKLMDAQVGGKFENLGSYSVPLRALYSENRGATTQSPVPVFIDEQHTKQTGTITIEVSFIKSGVPTGMISPSPSFQPTQPGFVSDPVSSLQEVKVKVNRLEGGLEHRSGAMFGKEKTDPFVEVSLKDQKGFSGKKERTTTKWDAGGKTVWLEEKRLPVLPGQEILVVDLYDDNKLAQPEHLGSAEIRLRDLYELTRGAAVETPLRLRGREGQVGVVYITVPFASASYATQSPLPTVDYNAVTEITITVQELKDGIEYCQGLMGRDKTDPFIKMQLGSQIQQTKERENAGGNARFDETFKFKNTGTDKLVVELWDHNHVTAAERLGTQEVSLRAIFLKGQGSLQKEFVTLKSIKPSNQHAGIVTISVAFKVHRPDQLVNPGQPHLHVKVVRLENGPQTRGMLDTTDPYFKLCLKDSQGRKSELRQTKVKANGGGNCRFDEIFFLPITQGTDTLRVELYDEETFRGDELLGSGEMHYKSMLTPNEFATRTIDMINGNKFNGRVHLELMWKTGAAPTPTVSNNIDGQDWLPYPGPPGYMSSVEALRKGNSDLNAPPAPSGYRFAGWAPPPDGRIHDGSWSFEGGKWMRYGDQPKVTWTHIRDPQILAQQEHLSYMTNPAFMYEMPAVAPPMNPNYLGQMMPLQVPARQTQNIQMGAVPMPANIPGPQMQMPASLQHPYTFAA